MYAQYSIKTSTVPPNLSIPESVESCLNLKLPNVKNFELELTVI